MHDRIRDVLPMGGDIDVRQVYGIEGYVTRGILFAASHDGDLLVRLDSESRMEALELSGATTWSPDDGVESYVIIPSYHLNSDETLRYWVNRALDYAEALGLEGEEDEMDDAFEEYEAPRSSFADGPMEANGSTHDGDEDDMEGEEVRMPPPAPRPKPVKPVAPKPAPAAPVAAAPAAPKAAAPAKPKAAPAKKKAAPKKTAKAAPARTKAAAGKMKGAPARKKAAPKTKSSAAPKKKKAATAKKARTSSVSKKKPAVKKPAVKRPAVKKPAAKKAAKKAKTTKRR